MIKWFSMLAVVLGLTACAARSVDPSYNLDASAKEGVITGSISYSGRLSGYNVHYRNLSTGDTGRIQVGEAAVLIPIRPKNDLNDRKTFGNIFAIALAPGNFLLNQQWLLALRCWT